MAKTNPHPEEPIGNWLRALSGGLDAELAKKAAEHELSFHEWQLIRDLARHAGLVPSVIAARLGMTRSAVSKLVARLEARRIVMNLPSEIDERYRVISLDDAGFDLASEVTATSKRVETAFFARLAGAERQHFVATLKQLVAEHGLEPPTEESGK